MISYSFINCLYLFIMLFL